MGIAAYFFFHNFTAEKSAVTICAAPLKLVTAELPQDEKKNLPQKPKYLESIEMLISGFEDYQTKEDPPISFAGLSGAPINYESDLSETIDDLIVILHPFQTI